MKNLLSLLFTLFTLLMFSQRNSQPEILQKLEVLYSKTKHTTDDIDQMISFCDELSVYDPELSLAHLKKVKNKMKQVNNLNSITFYCSQLSRNYIITRKFDQGIQAIDKLYEEYNEDLSKLQKIHFQTAKLTILEAKGDFGSCFTLIDEILPQTELIDNDNSKHYQAVMYNVKGSILSVQRGKYKEAVDSYLQVLRIYQEINDEENNIAMTYNRLGLLHSDMKDYSKSVSYFLNGISYLENIPPKSATEVYNLLILYSNLGDVYKEMGISDQAIQYQNKALKLAEDVNSEIDKSRILHNLGKIYLQNKQFSEALDYFQTSQQMCRLLEVPEGLMQNYLLLGKTYIGLKKFKESQIAFDSALVYVREFAYPRGEVDVYEGYAELY